MKELVYVCSPYSGDIPANTAYAQRCCRKLVEQGFIPLAPHLLFPQFISEETERERALDLGIQLLAHCSSIWVFGKRISAGMQREIEAAERLHIKVYYAEAD